MADSKILQMLDKYYSAWLRLKLSQSDHYVYFLTTATHPQPPQTFRTLPGKVQSYVSIYNLIVTKLDEVKKKSPPHAHPNSAKLNQAKSKEMKISGN